MRRIVYREWRRDVRGGGRVSPGLGPLGLVVAFGALFVAATSFSRAGQVARSLPPLADKTVQVAVWGESLPNSGGAALRLDSIRPFGAALLVHFRPIGGGPRHPLKVAQPRDFQIAPDHVTIAEAAYVIWAGARLSRQSDQPALQLSWQVPQTEG